VDDPHLEDTARPTFRQIVGHQLLHFPRLEGVQIQDAADRQFNGDVVVDLIPFPAAS
jgi:hypothetical protein